MNFSQDEMALLATIAQRNATNIRGAIMEAYEAGMAEQVKRTSALITALAAQKPTAPVAPTGGDDDDDTPGGVTPADAAWLRQQGIDPTKKFRVKNSLFTIVGVRQSRWKFPVSAVNQNGTRYKFPIAQIKQYQAR